VRKTGVIFDMDGVLALTEQAHWQSWCAAAKVRGVHIEYETFVSCFGRVNADCIAIMFGPDVTPEESARIAEEKERAFRDILRQNVPLAPGTAQLLGGLRERGIGLAVGSSGPRENVELVLNSGEIRRYFDAVVHGGEVARGKPAPDVFLLAAERLGVPAKACAVIEDAPAGIQAAVAAEMTPIAVATTHDSAELKKAGAIAIFPDLLSIPLEFLAKSAGLREIP
jgi:beta-phosphoglucomutase family hydrolase